MECTKPPLDSEPEKVLAEKLVEAKESQDFS